MYEEKKKMKEKSVETLRKNTGSQDDVNRREQTEESQHESEKKYRTLLDTIEEGYFETDLAGNLTFFNNTVCLILDYPREELIGMNYRQYSDKEDLKRVFQAYNKVYITGEPNREFGWQITRKDGTKKYIEGSISLQKDSSDKPIGFRGVIREITERKKIEKKLRDEEQRFRALAEHSSDIIVLVNRKGIITYENPAMERILGFKAEERIGASLLDLIHPDDLKFIIDIAKKSARDRTAPVLQDEVRLRHRDGNWHTFEITASSLVDDTVIEGGIINLHDITERKQAEEKLKQTLESLRKAVGTTIQVLVSALESKDPYTAGHQSRSADLARTIATEMGLSQDKIEGIRMAGSIHDIGKLSIPTEILAKTAKLTNIEFSMIKVHSSRGYDMLKDIESPWPLAEIVYQHHERIDGTGYPRNLKGDDIIIEARIMAVADVVEAIASHRPYRPSLGIETALGEIEKNKGVLYDDAVVDVCLRLFRDKGYKFP
jgi:PAS domain S-box-containing protein